MKETFEPAEMSALWSRLKTVLKKSNNQVQQTWSEIEAKGKHSNKQEDKRIVLAGALKVDFEVDKFQTFVVKEVMQLVRTKTQGTKTKVLYRGELHQIHGVREAEAFIKKGKYVRTVDQDGDECFIKSQAVQTETHSMTRTQQTERTGEMNPEEQDMLAKAMMAPTSVSVPQTLAVLCECPDDCTCWHQGTSLFTSSARTGFRECPDKCACWHQGLHVFTASARA